MSAQQTNGYPDVPSEFGYWLAGLIDGEGCFSIHPVNETGWTAHFYLILRDDDRAVLEDIQRTTGLGRIYERQPAADKPTHRPNVAWHVYRKADKLQLVRLLERYPLRAKKARDFAIWREAVIALARNVPGGRRQGPNATLASLSRQLRSVRAYEGRDAIELPEPPPTLFDVACSILGGGACAGISSQASTRM